MGFWRQAFTLDARSLAAARIATGVVLLGDLCSRALEFRMHYTEWGILPRLAMFDNRVPVFPGIYTWSDWPVFLVAVFVLHGLLAVALSLGYRTRLTTVLCWFFTHSLQRRNYLVNNGGDVVLVALLFWAMFIPWGRAWSLDSLVKPRAREPEPVYNLGSALLVGQLLLIYWVSVIHKTEPTWTSGKAVHYALGISFYSRPLASMLLPYSGLLTGLTYLTLVWEAIGPALLIAPWARARLLAAGAFTFMHLCFGLFLRLGIFVFSPMLYFLALLPGEFWDWLEARIRPPGRAVRAALRFNRRLGTPRPSPYRLHFVWKVVLPALFVYGLVFSLSQDPRIERFDPEQLRWIPRWTGLNQTWRVFINLPDALEGWVVVEADLSDGSQADIFQDRQPPQFQEPREPSRRYRSFRWPTPIVTIVQSEWLQPWFVRALADDWQRRHPQNQVVEARFYLCTRQQRRLLSTWTPDSTPEPRPRRGP